MSVVVSYKRQTVVFVVMAIIALAATEAAVRLLEETVEPRCAFLYHELYSDIPASIKKDMCREYWSVVSDYDGQTYTMKPMNGTHVNIGEGGFRGPGPATIDEGSYRIFMLGGSTTFGSVTTSDDLTIPALLEKKLRDSGLDARVVNGGVSAANTYDERYRLDRHVEEWDPDMVIMYDGVNELVYQGATYEEFLDVEYWYRLEDGGGLRVPLPDGYDGLLDIGGPILNAGALAGQLPDGYDVLADAANQSEAINHKPINGRHDLQPTNATEDEVAGRQWGPGIGIARLAIWLDYKTALGTIQWLRDVTTPAPPPINHSSWESDVVTGDPAPVIERSLHANWAAVCELGEAGGFTTVNFLQPHLGTADRTISEHEVPSYYASQMIRTDPPTYAKTSEFLSNVSLYPLEYYPCKNVHDLRSVFDGMDGVTIYYDWHHMRGSGNNVVASAMYDIVRPLVIMDLNR